MTQLEPQLGFVIVQLDVELQAAGRGGEKLGADELGKEDLMHRGPRNQGDNVNKELLPPMLAREQRIRRHPERGRQAASGAKRR